MEKLKNLLKNKKLLIGIGCGILAVALIATLICTVVGCNGQNAGGTETTGSTESTGTVETTAPIETTIPTESTAAPTDETQPVETQPFGTEPVETTIPETEPIETEPPVTEPVETEPVETQPAETQPVETEPAETEPEVVWTEVDETVYATSTVNVRKGPSSDTKKLGSLNKGDSVKRTAIGDNGWSRVEYDGKEAYIYSDYLSTKKPADNSTVSYDGLDIAKLAVEYLELEYVYGGNSLTKGVDCSGFTTQIYKQFGIDLPRTAAEQSKVGTKVSLADAKPGDLYAEEYSDKTNYTGHAGIYIGNGYIISAWPNSGVYITSVSEDTTFRRIGKNTCTTTGEDAIRELEKHLISKGEYGAIDRVTYNPDLKDFAIQGSSPLKCGMFDGFSISFWLSDVPDGYEDLWNAWKKQYQKGDAGFNVAGYYGYYNGQWYTKDELKAMYRADEITEDVRYGANRFFGDFWDKVAPITNALGEAVDLSTCPT